MLGVQNQKTNEPSFKYQNTDYRPTIDRRIWEINNDPKGINPGVHNQRE